MATEEEVNTTRLTLRPYCFADFKIPVAPLTAGPSTSLGSSQAKMTGEATWKMASQPTTASSYAPSFSISGTRAMVTAPSGYFLAMNSPAAWVRTLLIHRSPRLSLTQADRNGENHLRNDGGVALIDEVLDGPGTDVWRRETWRSELKAERSKIERGVHPEAPVTRTLPDSTATIVRD